MSSRLTRMGTANPARVLVDLEAVRTRQNWSKLDDQIARIVIMSVQLYFTLSSLKASKTAIKRRAFWLDGPLHSNCFRPTTSADTKSYRMAEEDGYFGKLEFGKLGHGTGACCWAWRYHINILFEIYPKGLFRKSPIAFDDILQCIHDINHCLWPVCREVTFIKAKSCRFII